MGKGAVCLNEYKPIEERLGQIGVNKLGELMQIIKCYPDYRVDVKFLDGKDCVINIKYSNFRDGIAKNYNRVEYGFNGYIGQGPYDTIDKSNLNNKGKARPSKAFNVWVAMHRRAGNYSGEKPSYKDVAICEEWWNFQNFAKWYEENLYDSKGIPLCLDKDILYPGNKVYSPHTCRLVPDPINQLFKSPPIKNSDLPTGVFRNTNKNKNKYSTVVLQRLDENNMLYKFKYSSDNILWLHDKYKEARENYIHSMAELYKDILVDEIYQAMITYSFDKYNI